MLRHRLKTGDLASRSKRNAALISFVRSIRGSPQRIHQFTNFGSKRRHIIGHKKLWNKNACRPSVFNKRLQNVAHRCGYV